MIALLDYMWGKMTKNILAAVFFSLISYAIISDLGKPQHSYSSPYSAAIVD